MARRSSSSSDRGCDVSGCGEKAERSLSAKKVGNAGMSIPEKHGNVHLCKEHYKEYKKKTKKTRELERMGW